MGRTKGDGDSFFFFLLSLVSIATTDALAFPFKMMLLTLEHLVGGRGARARCVTLLPQGDSNKSGEGKKEEESGLRAAVR